MVRVHGTARRRAVADRTSCRTAKRSSTCAGSVATSCARPASEHPAARPHVDRARDHRGLVRRPRRRPMPGDDDATRCSPGSTTQQRVAAEALLGPVCMLAGAGTGKTRAITHRIAYGVATGVYAPSRVMALTFTARGRGGAARPTAALGAGGCRRAHLPRRRARAAQLLLAAGRRRHDAEILDSKGRLLAPRRRGAEAQARHRRRCVTSPPRSSGARSRASASTSTRRESRRARCPAGSTSSRSPTCSGLRDAQGRAPAARLRRRAARHARA